METPMLNFVGAVGIGVVIGIVGGLIFKKRSANAIWMSPVLATVGAVVASVAALVAGDRNDYGWKEITLQVVLALLGVGATYMMGGKASGGR